MTEDFWVSGLCDGEQTNKNHLIFNEKKKTGNKNENQLDLFLSENVFRFSFLWIWMFSSSMWTQKMIQEEWDWFAIVKQKWNWKIKLYSMILGGGFDSFASFLLTFLGDISVFETKWPLFQMRIEDCRREL